MKKDTRTYLDTSDGMTAYAKRYGAEFDHERGQWYVDGEVRHELLGLLPKQPRRPVYKVVPFCPICGAFAEQKERKSDGHLFWGCSQFIKTGCRGSVDYDDYLNALTAPEKARNISEFICAGGDNKDPSSVAVTNKLQIPSELRSEIEKIVALAIITLGGRQSAERWLATPKYSLKGKAPLEVMTSIQGCCAVERLVRAANN